MKMKDNGENIAFRPQCNCLATNYLDYAAVL